jgi:hypothetical protein
MNRDDIIRTIDWILDLCPEIDKWQAEIIAEYASNLVKNERDECAKLCDPEASMPNEAYVVLNNKATMRRCAAAIRARGQS